MSLPFARAIAPDTPILLAAALAGRRRPKHLPRGRNWFRVADRLAAGLPPAAAALPEGGDEGQVLRLLERGEFRSLVAAAEARLAEPPETHRKRLIGLARQCLETALLGEDTGAALFVLEEEAKNRDPSATLADGVLRSRRRTLAPQAPAAEAEPAPRGTAAYDPLRRMMHRGTARLRAAVETEEALRTASLQAAATDPAGSEATRTAAANALALRLAAEADATPLEPRHGMPPLQGGIGAARTPGPAATHEPRRTRGP